MAAEDSSTPFVQAQGNYGTQGKDVSNVEDLKEKVSHLYVSHFQARRSKRSSGMKYNRDFLAFKSSADSKTVTVVYFESHFDELRLRAERYELNEEHIKSFIKFEDYKCHHVTYANNTNEDTNNTNEDARMNKELKYIIANIGSTWYDDTDQDRRISEPSSQTNSEPSLQTNSEPSSQSNSGPLSHVMLESMYHAERENLRRKKCQCFINLLPLLKSVGFLATLLIAFISVAFTSNVRQAHIRIFGEMVLLFQKQAIHDFKKCTDDYGEKVIDATRNRISIVMEEDYPEESQIQTELIKNVSKFLDTDKVCEIASHFGRENVRKTTGYLAFIWFFLQVAFILVYENLHLNRILKNNPRGYLKSILMEVVGGIVPMLISLGVGFIIQHYMSKPTVLYVFLTCLSAACTRLLVTACLCCSSCNYTRCYFSTRNNEGCSKRCNVLCWISFVLALAVMIAYVVFIMRHYIRPEKGDIL